MTKSQSAAAPSGGNAVCPECKMTAPGLLKIDAGLRLRLQESGHSGPTPTALCQNCYARLMAAVSQGAKLRAEENVKEQNRQIVWKNRVNLVKQGRVEFESRKLSEAAISYEKYIKILEVTNEVGPGGLTPDMFKGSGRAKELPVLSSVLWDLVRIYDASPRMKERQRAVATQLARFASVAQGGTPILRQASKFVKTAKNPEVIRNMLKQANFSSSSCFIATATFQGDYNAPEVVILSAYRDEILQRSLWGRSFIEIYYFFSPPLADFITKTSWFRRPLRWWFGLLSRHLQSRYQLNSNSKNSVMNAGSHKEPTL